ncbi:copper resistance protein B [Gracilimonas tropica]|uniref:copper resistance protein B n=1 Tax=Gracilimonas tropica TaxID=454600 RepID=UPI00037F3E03|nr:copper resistance protein B [Gracilimonas tropica]
MNVTIKEVRPILILLMFLLVGAKSVTAQKAPPFSNDIMPDNKTYFFFQADRFEYYSIGDPSPVVWDVQGYIGTDIHKFWYKAEGEALTTEQEGEMEFQGLYSRAITSYFDFQAGLRYDLAYNSTDNNSRGFAVIGFQGLAPYLFEVDGSLQLSEDGDVSATFEGEIDLLVTQRLIAQPRFATNLALQEVEEWGVGSGINNVQLGFRLRYEIRREFAPYVGVSWNQKLGQTADYARLEGGEDSTLGLVGGIRMWF